MRVICVIKEVIKEQKSWVYSSDTHTRFFETGWGKIKTTRVCHKDK